MIILFFSLALAILIYRHKTWKALPWPKHAMRPPPYQGHRGYWQEGVQENTLEAFYSAKKRGLKMFELDVQAALYSEPVVFHDVDLRRIGNSEDLVCSKSLIELKKRVNAPSLREVLADSQCPDYVNIEIKTDSIWDCRLEKAVSQVIKATGSEKRVMFSSFNPLCLLKMSFLLPQVPRALLATEEMYPRNKVYFRKLWLAPYARVHALHLDYRFVSEQKIRKLKKQGIPVALWTVNQKELAEGYLKAGALSIITDTLGKVGDENFSELSSL